MYVGSMSPLTLVLILFLPLTNVRYENILSGSRSVSYPDFFSQGQCDIIKRLLKQNQSRRLGRTKGGCAAIMKHRWFSGFAWDELMSRTHEVPIKPSTDLTDNFDTYPDDDDDEPRACGWNPVL